MLTRNTLLFFLASPWLLIALYQWNQSTLLYPFILLWIGLLMGGALNYFQFGFSSSFRDWLLNKKTVGMRAIMWMLGFAIILFAPLLAMQTMDEQSFTGFIRTLGLALPVGALLFGIGMQIGCGCTSGTLNRVGQLQALSVSTLFFMIIGGTLAAATFDVWGSWPALPPVSFQMEFGWGMGLLIQLGLLSLIYAAFKRHERMHTRELIPLFKGQASHSFAHPFLLAGLSLAILNATLLFISGSPWSISSMFPYWGSRLIDTAGLPFDWAFWEYSMENATRMNQGWLENPVSLTTMGVILGAFLVSLLRPRTKVPVTVKGLSGSMAGGLIMGYGAVMASGCNIGAFFSGIASGSLHGWVWFAFAILGNFIGVMIRQRMLAK